MNIGYRDGYCKRCEDFRLLVGEREQTPHLACLTGFAATGVLAGTALAIDPLLAILPMGFGVLLAVAWFLHVTFGVFNKTYWRCNKCGLPVRPSDDIPRSWITGAPLTCKASPRQEYPVAAPAAPEIDEEKAARWIGPPPVPEKPLR